MYSLFFFILGTIFGSFINAAEYRLRHSKKLAFARSFCPWCKTQLSAKELIPLVSFFSQRGRCLTCKKKISWQYPLVEVVTGILFVLVYITQFQFDTLAAVSFAEIIHLVGYFVLIVFLVLIFVYDLKYYQILDKVTFPAMAVALVWNLASYFSLSLLISLLVGALVAGGFFFLQFVLSQGKWIGGGDIRLGLLMGFALGWPHVLVALMLAYIVGAIFSIGMLVLRQKKWGSQIPFGTFLSLGTFIALLWAPELIRWYINLF